MCGRFTLTTVVKRLAEQFELTGELPEFTPSYNIAPTQEIAAIADSALVLSVVAPNPAL